MSWKSWRPARCFGGRFAASISFLCTLHTCQLKRGILAQCSFYFPDYPDYIDCWQCVRRGHGYKSYSQVAPGFVRSHLQYCLAIKVQNFWSPWARGVDFHPTSSPSSQDLQRTSSLVYIFRWASSMSQKLFWYLLSTAGLTVLWRIGWSDHQRIALQ